MIWVIGNRNDKRASSGCGENYVTETGQTNTFSPGHPTPRCKGEVFSPPNPCTFQIRAQ